MQQQAVQRRGQQGRRSRRIMTATAPDQRPDGAGAEPGQHRRDLPAEALVAGRRQKHLTGQAQLGGVGRILGNRGGEPVQPGLDVAGGAQRGGRVVDDLPPHR